MLLMLVLSLYKNGKENEDFFKFKFIYFNTFNFKFQAAIRMHPKKTQAAIRKKFLLRDATISFPLGECEFSATYIHCTN